MRNLIAICLFLLCPCLHAYEYSVPPGDANCPNGYGGPVFTQSPGESSVHYSYGGVLTFYSDEMTPDRVFFRVGLVDFAIPAANLLVFDRNPDTCGFAIVYDPETVFQNGFERPDD